MDRRRFLALLGMAGTGAAMAEVFDLERLLWMPGAKTIFLPTVRSRNTFLTTDIIVEEALKVFEHHLQLMQKINLEYSERLLWSEAVA